MEYVLNWMVLLLSLGGIAIVALLCYSDMVKNTARVRETAPPVTEIPMEPHISAAEVPAQAGPFMELQYRRGDAVEFVQRVDTGRKGYIGTESYQPMGTGMPVRYVEIESDGGGFEATNLDWQMPARLKAPDGTETEAPVGEPQKLEDGSEIILSGGWTISCRMSEGPDA